MAVFVIPRPSLVAVGLIGAYNGLSLLHSQSQTGVVLFGGVPSAHAFALGRIGLAKGPCWFEMQDNEEKNEGGSKDNDQNNDQNINEQDNEQNNANKQDNEQDNSEDDSQNVVMEQSDKASVISKSWMEQLMDDAQNQESNVVMEQSESNVVMEQSESNVVMEQSESNVAMEQSEKNVAKNVEKNVVSEPVKYPVAQQHSGVAEKMWHSLTEEARQAILAEAAQLRENREKEGRERYVREKPVFDFKQQLRDMGEVKEFMGCCAKNVGGSILISAEDLSQDFSQMQRLNIPGQMAVIKADLRDFSAVQEYLRGAIAEEELRSSGGNSSPGFLDQIREAESKVENKLAQLFDLEEEQQGIELGHQQKLQNVVQNAFPHPQGPQQPFQPQQAFQPQAHGVLQEPSMFQQQPHGVLQELFQDPPMVQVLDVFHREEDSRQKQKNLEEEERKLLAPVCLEAMEPKCVQKLREQNREIESQKQGWVL
jgi:hypothetical protein